MGHGVLLVSSVPELVGAQQDAVVDMEASTLLRGAHSAMDVLRVQVAAQLGHLVLEELDDGRVLHEVVAVGLAALAERVGFQGVHLFEVFALERYVAVACHMAAHQDGEGVAPGVVDRVELGAVWPWSGQGARGIGHAAGGVFLLRHVAEGIVCRSSVGSTGVWRLRWEQNGKGRASFPQKDGLRRSTGC